MRIKVGDMFDEIHGVTPCRSAKRSVLVTGNSYLAKHGGVVMGHGAAKQLALRVTGIDKQFGALIRDRCGHLGEYLTAGTPDGWGLLQVKYNFKHAADLGLIERSINKLNFVADIAFDHEFHCNFPGIGNGKLHYWDVYDIIKNCPDNVTFWKLPGETS